MSKKAVARLLEIMNFTISIENAINTPCSLKRVLRDIFIIPVIDYPQYK
jgi:hypothetical protein